MWSMEYEIEQLQEDFAKQMGSIDIKGLTDDFIEDMLLQSKPLQGVLSAIRNRQRVNFFWVEYHFLTCNLTGYFTPSTSFHSIFYVGQIGRNQKGIRCANWTFGGSLYQTTTQTSTSPTKTSRRSQASRASSSSRRSSSSSSCHRIKIAPTF